MIELDEKDIIRHELVTKVVDGKFPDYQRVIPVNQPRHLKANRQTVMQALQRDHRITLAGPTTLLAMLSSLQM